MRRSRNGFAAGRRRPALVSLYSNDGGCREQPINRVREYLTRDQGPNCGLTTTPSLARLEGVLPLPATRKVPLDRDYHSARFGARMHIIRGLCRCRVNVSYRPNADNRLSPGIAPLHPPA